MKKWTCWTLVLLIVAQPVFAFGPEGHHLVGAIADQLLKSKPESQKIKELLDGISLADAALIPDDLKSWNGGEDPQKPWTKTPHLADDLKIFLQANSNPPHSHGHNPDHHNFHYTDISVNSGNRPLTYSLSRKGATRTDVVQMITFCIHVLDGTHPEHNEFRITKRVAVVLLAHYLGDIHQPLHVGCAYFDSHAKVVDPEEVPTAQQDKGGNDVQLVVTGSNSQSTALHSFWDGESVKAAFHQIRQAEGESGSKLTEAEVKAHFVDAKPAGSPLDHGVALPDLSTTWANEILPIAKAAHTKLKYENLNPPHISGHYKFRWKATEISTTPEYKNFAGETVKTSMHKAGWRLAKLLEDLL